jgi:hypothetical protein
VCKYKHKSPGQAVGAENEKKKGYAHSFIGCLHLDTERFKGLLRGSEKQMIPGPQTH